MAPATAALQTPPPAMPAGDGSGRFALVSSLSGIVTALRNLSGFGRKSRLDRLFSPRAVAERIELTAPDGERFTVEASGAGRPILLVHGLGGSHHDWDDAVEHLARTHRVYTFDLRGHGARAGVASQPTLEQMACDVALAIERLSLDRPVLAGHSMGALVVMRYLQRHGTQRLSGVCIVDQSPRVTTDTDWSLGLFGTLSRAQVQALIQRLRGDFVGTVLAEAAQRLRPLRCNGLASIALRWLLGCVHAAIGVAPVLSILESVIETDFRGVIAALRLPTLVVLGGSSHHYGGLPLADYYTDALARGIVTTYEGAAHSPHRQEPQRFAEDLSRFAVWHCA